jgi:hypothetical protein
MFHIIFTVESQALKVGHAKYCILLLQLYPLMLDESLYLAAVLQLLLTELFKIKISHFGLKKLSAFAKNIKIFTERRA